MKRLIQDLKIVGYLALLGLIGYALTVAVFCGTY